MMSATGRIKRLSILTKYLLKSEVLYVGFNTKFTRTLVIGSVLLNRSLIKRAEVPEFRKPSDDSKNLGEVIDLNVEFDEVKMDNKKIKRRKKINRTNLKLTDNEEVDSDVKKAEVTDSIHFHCETHNENAFKKSSKSLVVKENITDIKKNSKILSSAILNSRTSKLRKKNQKIIIEGKRLIHDAISAGFSPTKVFYSRKSDLEKLNLPESTPLYRVSYKNLNLWSDVVTPQGVMGVFDMPKLTMLKNSANTIPLTIICDNIRDSGNLGSILRVAAGVGCEKLILIKGCADIWESKVLRAGAGAHFRLPIVNNIQWSDVKDEIHEESKIILADFNNVFDNDSENKNDLENKTSNFKCRHEKSKSLPIYCYYSVEYGKANTVIIIGGESHGISDEAYELGVEKKGIRVFIPMNNEIESLNSSVALAILTYEFRRQFQFINGKAVLLQEINSDDCNNKAC